MSKNKVYLTTTLPYVNAAPHLGFAAELCHADIIARYHLLKGDEVFFNTGTDEHGLKIYQAAAAALETPGDFVAAAAAPFKNLLPALGVWSGANFIRTTDAAHAAAAQEFWRRSAAAGDIYKKNYQTKYCVGCELEKTDSELTDGRCSLHPNRELELVEEENYFFRFSKYQKPLSELYEKNPNFVVPESRFHEIRAFVERGLTDFSVSRLRSKLPWGIPVPDDPAQTMYVWFDALVNYISAIGWPHDLEKFEKWWVESGGVIQFAGKDNLRQQAAMWQAMLMSAGLPPSRQIIIRGFIQSGGQKMSKSLGNVLDPFALVNEYGAEAVRYFLARHVNPFEDSEVTPEKFKEAYNANLANGLGNLVSRVMKMATVNGIKFDEAEAMRISATEEFENYYREHTKNLANFDIQKSIDMVWREITLADELIQREAPFKKIKTDKATAEKDVKNLLARLWFIAVQLEPFLPQTAKTIQELIAANQMPAAPLFPRK